jgi:hypothetical protein
MPGVFISYRREDCPGHAGRIFDRLRTRFGTDSVFIDVAGIEAGVDFIEALEKAVGSCDVLLAIIGREWVASTDRKGRRRLDDPRDFLRLEISTALKRDVRVIPVLVEDAPMPSADVLPDDLIPLTRRQAVELRDTRWDADVDDLIALLAKLLRVEAPAALRPTQLEPQNPQRSVTERMDRMDHTLIPARRSPRPTKPPRPQSATWSIGAALLIVLGILMVGIVAPRYMPERLGFLPFSEPAPRTSPPAPGPQIVQDAIGVVEPPPPSATEEPTAPARTSTNVPNVVGQTLERGSAALRRAGFSLGSSASKAARGVAAFQIISQTPSAGTTVTPGTRVDLVYARPMRTLPNVAGDSLEDAIATLKASGFDPRPMARSTNDAPPQQVLSQAPAGGSELEPEAVVELVYAVAAKIKVPNVVGLDVTSAQKTLRSAGLVIGSRSGTNANAPAYQVVRQDPLAGSEVDKNTAVALFYAWDPSPPGAPAQ